MEFLWKIGRCDYIDNNSFFIFYDESIKLHHPNKHRRKSIRLLWKTSNNNSFSNNKRG